MSKLSIEAQDAIQIEEKRKAALGLRIVPAALLKKEEGGYRYGSHAKDRNGKTYPLQQEKVRAISSSFAQNGILDFEVPASLADDNETVIMLGRRHTISQLPDDYPVKVRVEERSAIQNLTTAARLNGESMGFSMTAVVEQTFAFVMELCNVLESVPVPRTGFWADLQLPKPKGQRGYTADRDGNPFASHTKRGEAWGPLSYTGDGLAKMMGVSPATMQRALDILSGLWNAQEDPTAVAGMKTDNAIVYARSVSKLDGKLGETKPSNEQRATKKKVQSALKGGKVLKDATGRDISRDPGRIADSIFAGSITVENPPEKESGNGRSAQRTHVARIVDLLKEAIKLTETLLQDEDLPGASFTDRLFISKAFSTIDKNLDAISERDAKKDAESAIAESA